MTYLRLKCNPDLTPCPVDKFKAALDRHLSMIPDQPLVPGMTLYRHIDSNSLTAWATHPSKHSQPPAERLLVAAPQ